ncbi:phosphatase PAP2 family protein [Streptomyces sp. NPDC057638]|uniref:phosphatase PAP2 family protein n=1 Tax=Streptomyces sp. NPDC057638 TaxID=3346190 RepID=UPI00368867FD
MLSLAGEHGALWLLTGLAGTATAHGRDRRTAWLRATALVAAAHLGSVALKRLVGRARPGSGPEQGPAAAPLVPVASPYSFPSSHATSSVAAAVAFGALAPGVRRVARPVAAAVCLSRVVAGVHYPTDVAAGAVLGGLTARWGARWLTAAVTGRAGVATVRRRASGGRAGGPPEGPPGGRAGSGHRAPATGGGRPS